MRKTSFWLGAGLVAGGTFWGCGSDDSGLEGASGSGGSAGATADGSSGGSAGASSGGSAGLSCEGTHPEGDGGDRRCGEGECRCVATDLCFLEENAARCCEGELECFRADGGKFDCKGTHPQVDGSDRFCEKGDCFCGKRDVCLPADQAAACCPETPKCN